MIRIKPGVSIHPASVKTPEVMHILWVAQDTAPAEYNITVTSGCDGVHHAKSKHYDGRAFDFRIRDFPVTADCSLATWVRRMQARLGDEYFVLLEKDHIHVQWNGAIE